MTGVFFCVTGFPRVSIWDIGMTSGKNNYQDHYCRRTLMTVMSKGADVCLFVPEPAPMASD
jgi:hypothetical protein